MKPHSFIKFYLKRSSASSKQSIQDKVQSLSNPGSSMRVSDSAYGVQHFCLARAAIEVQYQPSTGRKQSYPHTGTAGGNTE